MTVANTINGALRKIPAWPIYWIVAAWTGWMFYLAATGKGGGPEPINWLEREYGEFGLKLLIAGLLITPVRTWTGINLIKFRRAIGVTTCFLILAHFLVWAVLDVQAFERVFCMLYLFMENRLRDTAFHATAQTNQAIGILRDVI